MWNPGINLTGKAELIGVVKADYYGLGAVKICEILKEEGVKIFAVATIAEGIALRDAGYTDEDIIVLGLSPGIYADVIVKYPQTKTRTDLFFSGHIHTVT